MATETFSYAAPHPRQRVKRSNKFQQIFGNDKIDEEYPVVHKRPMKKTLYPQISLRGYNALRAARLVRLYSLDGERPSNITLDRDQGVDEPAYEYQCRC